jgi:hypothetical protein
VPAVGTVVCSGQNEVEVGQRAKYPGSSAIFDVCGGPRRPLGPCLRRCPLRHLLFRSCT